MFGQLSIVSGAASAQLKEVVSSEILARVFELQPTWDERGDSFYHLVDSVDDDFNVELLHRVVPIAHAWTSPSLLSFPSAARPMSISARQAATCFHRRRETRSNAS
jgi:hypothetical protein